MGEMEIPDELIDQLLGEYEGPEQLTGPDEVRVSGFAAPLLSGSRGGCPPPAPTEPCLRCSRTAPRDGRL